MKRLAVFSSGTPARLSSLLESEPWTGRTSQNNHLGYEPRRVLISQFALNHFGQGDIRKSHTRLDLHQRPVSIRELSNSSGNDVDQDLCRGDYFCGLFKKMGLHNYATGDQI